MTNVLNPLSDTVTVYTPTGRAGTAKAPELLLTTVVSTAVALFFTTTVAPGITPPPVSTTSPDSEAVDCAYANELAIDTHRASITSLLRLSLIVSPSLLSVTRAGHRRDRRRKCRDRLSIPRDNGVNNGSLMGRTDQQATCPISADF